MSEFKGTPGPWDFSWQIQPNGCPTIGHKGLMVCMVAHSAKEQDQKEVALANAKLIAAAPDLLKALKGYMAAVDLMNAAMKDGINVHGAIAGIVGAEDEANWAIQKATA